MRLIEPARCRTAFSVSNSLATQQAQQAQRIHLQTKRIAQSASMTDPRGRHITLQKPQEPEDPNSMHHGGSFKKYMQFKNQKLREQFQSEAAEAVDGNKDAPSALFAGVSIHVNGFTNPSHQVSSSNRHSNSQAWRLHFLLLIYGLQPGAEADNGGQWWYFRGVLL